MKQETKKLVLDLEQAYNLKLKECKADEVTKTQNGFALDSNGDIVALNLSYTGITRLKPISRIKSLKYLFVVGNNLSDTNKKSAEQIAKDLETLCSLDLRMFRCDWSIPNHFTSGEHRIKTDRVVLFQSSNDVALLKDNGKCVCGVYEGSSEFFHALK